MKPVKSLLDIIRYLRKKILVIFFVSLVIALSEIMFLYSIIDLFKTTNQLLGNESLTICILIIIFIVITALQLYMVSKIKGTSFIDSFNFIKTIVYDKKTDYFVRNSTSLVSSLTVEKERLAREIIAPLLTAVSKVPLVILALLWFLYTAPLSSLIGMFVPIIIVFLVYALSALSFRRFSKRLKLGLSGYALDVASITKTFDMHSFKKTSPLIEIGNFSNINVAKAEFGIEVASQAPRMSLDVALVTLMIMGASSIGTDTLTIESLIVSAPIAMRTISNSQQMYKNFASIVSNLGAIAILNIGEDKGKASDDIQIRHTLKMRYDEGILIISNGGVTHQVRTIGISFNSGYGKTNGIINMFYDKMILPSSLAFYLANTERAAYVSAEPFVTSRSILKITEKIDTKHSLNNFIPSNRDANSCSSGELFKWNILEAIIEDSEVIVIDESIVHIQKPERQQLLDYLKGANIPVIIVSHTSEVLSLLDCIVSEGGISLRKSIKS